MAPLQRCIYILRSCKRLTENSALVRSKGCSQNIERDLIVLGNEVIDCIQSFDICLPINAKAMIGTALERMSLINTVRISLPD